VVRDIGGTNRLVKRYKVWEAQETLGVHLAPDGNTQAQFDKMYNKVIQWADKMQTGRIPKTEAWLAVMSTIWRTLYYPLPAINLTKKQCDKLMAPLLNYLLPALGVCRTFPRSLVFAPIQYMGLGIKHIHTIQEITWLKDILQHAMQDSLLGSLYKNSLSCLIIELGFDAPLHTIPYSTFLHLVTDSLNKSSWEFLYQHQLELKHTMKMHAPHQGDSSILWR
jgi:hypothetical protein